MLFYYETEDKLEYTKCTAIRISCAASTLDKLVNFNSEQHKLGIRESTEHFVKECILYTYAKFKTRKLRL